MKTLDRIEIGRSTPLTGVSIPDSLRPLHLRCAGEPGTGKTVLAALLAFQDAVRGIPTLLVDATGAMINAFVKLALSHPRGREVLARFVYFPINRFDRLPWLSLLRAR